MKTPKIDDGGAAARAEEARKKAEAEAKNLEANYKADLTTENVTEAVAGGTAEAVVGDTLKKRKPQTLSSSLGINV